MEIENANSNGDNVVASNLINVNFLIFENCENQVQKWRSYVSFSIRCHDCPKNKIPHIVYLTNNIEWIKVSLVNMDLFYKKENNDNFLEVFLVNL